LCRLRLFFLCPVVAELAVAGTQLHRLRAVVAVHPAVAAETLLLLVEGMVAAALLAVVVARRVVVEGLLLLAAEVAAVEHRVVGVAVHLFLVAAAVVRPVVVAELHLPLVCLNQARVHWF